MREILFRGKRVDNNEWVYGYLIKGATRYVIQESIAQYPQYDIIPETIGQYTGLTDKNGKKVFEGDIVQWTDVKMEIFWGEEIGMGYGFCWRNIKGKSYYHESMTGFIDEYEVIGNIYDKEVEE